LPVSTNVSARLLVLHDEVDEATTPLTHRHASILKCKLGCVDCCRDDITVFEVEAAAIRDAYPDVLSRQDPHPVGACAFLDDAGACRIYERRPYVCRTQGLPFRWDDEDEAGALVQRRDICPLNEPPTPLADMPDAHCWQLGPFEGRLATLQVEASGRMEDLPRVALRALFVSTPPA
jgi:uncharacterized protein